MKLRLYKRSFENGYTLAIANITAKRGRISIIINENDHNMTVEIIHKYHLIFLIIHLLDFVILVCT